MSTRKRRPSRPNVKHLGSYSSLATAPAAPNIVTEPEAPERAFWAGTIGMENELTGDARLIENSALVWDASEDDPLPFRYVSADVGLHDGAVVVGHIFGVERRPGGVIWAWGDFDLGSEHGLEARRQVAEKLSNGVSMDLDDVSFEIRVAKEIMDERDELRDALMSEDGEMPEIEREEVDGRVVVVKMSPDDELTVTTEARIRSATLVAIPAFAGAKIELIDQPPTGNVPPARSVDEEVESEGLAASASPIAPPRSWFEVPEASGPTPLTVTADGQIYGHLATWNVCHIGSPNGADVCVVAPRSPSGYAHYHTGSVLTAEGVEVATGRVTMGTGHARLSASAMNAAAHYDNTGAAAADVVAKDGQFGIWVCGAARPGTTAEQLRTLRGSPLSGDWRKIGGQFEMVGALAVNVPGFPVPRTAGLVASGEMKSLVAMGMLEAKIDPIYAGQLSAADVATLRSIARRDRRGRADKLASRVASTRRSKTLEKIAAFAAGRS